MNLKDIEHEVGVVVSSGALSPALARVLRGRLLFARSQAFGRIGAAALYALGRVAAPRCHPCGSSGLGADAARLARRTPPNDLFVVGRACSVIHRRRLRTHRPTRAAV